MSAFFLIWQDPESRRWHPVGKLVRTGSRYMFQYTKGALESKNFVPFGNLKKMEAIYVSNQLFPIFANRVMNERRPEYKQYASWSDFDNTSRVDPLLLMARMGGVRATDTLQVYPVPEKDQTGKYKTIFFCHGLNHMPKASISRVMECAVGERLFPMLDVQNNYDVNAVSLRTDDPTTMLGYCPRHLSTDLRTLTENIECELEIKVVKVNFDAPSKFKLLCSAKAFWPENFQPCDQPEYEPLVTWPPKASATIVSNGSRGDDLEKAG